MFSWSYNCTYLTISPCYSISPITEAIVQGPFNTAADVGLWANFTCSVSCNHLINWFVEGYPSDISTTCTTTHNDLMVCKDVRHDCGPGSTNYTETLRVLAKTEHTGSNIAVQCAAIRRSVDNSNTCLPFITFSRYALLMGEWKVWIYLCVCV